MMNMRETFALGMDRDVPELLPFPTTRAPILNLGAGYKMIDDTTALGAETGWMAHDPLPYGDESVAGAYAFHFFEHLNKRDIFALLHELERVLIVGGSLITVTPHPSGSLAFTDLDHKSFWTEDTWGDLFRTSYKGRDAPAKLYNATTSRNWRFRVHVSVIMGIALRNLVTLTQIVKTS